MNNDCVLIGEIAREKLLEGVNLITDAIQCTYGPNAATVAIKNPAGIKITKDGKTVSEAVRVLDPYIQAGVDLIKEVSVKTAKEVGDGSSTVAILTRAIVNDYINFGNPIEISRKLFKERDLVLEDLKSHTKQISNKEDIKKVATLSANGDELIGETIAEAYDKVGKDGLVLYEKGESVTDRIEYSRGFRINSGFFSPYLINTSEGNIELNNVQVYISQTKMEETRKVKEIWQKAIDQGKSLLLIAPDFDSSITMLIYHNMFDPNKGGRMQAGLIQSPEFGVMRETILEDIKAVLGDSMCCDKVIITKDDTTFIGYNSNTEAVEERKYMVKQILENPLPEIEYEFHRRRLAMFSGGLAKIFVGGYSETEAKTRCDLYEDAISATACALKGGVLPGCGKALREAAKNLNVPLLKKALYAPTQILLDQATSSSGSVEDYWDVLNIRTGVSGDAFENGIIEPYLVVKETLENAVSAATNIISANCLIVNE